MVNARAAPLGTQPDQREHGENEVQERMFRVHLVAGETERARDRVGIERVQDRENAARTKMKARSDGESFHANTFVLKRINAAAPAIKQYQPNGRKSLCLK